MQLVAATRRLVTEFWGGECGLTLELQDRLDADVSVYHHNPYDAEYGGMEYAVSLPRRPRSNVLRFDLDSWGLDFFHQGPLTANAIAMGCYRPEHIVNSYAVYHKTQGGMVESSGPDYKTGKACHLYRSWSEDARGWRVWNRLHVRNSELTISIPQEFLESAKYPVVVDPTFGYTSIGASTDVGWSNALLGCVFATSTPASNGTLDSLTFYCVAKSGSVTFDPALYSNTSTAPDARLAKVDSGGTAMAATSWITTNLAYSSLVSGTQYWLGYTTADSGTYNIAYDSSFPDNELKYRIVSPPWPDPFGSPSTLQWRVSVYANYTAAGGFVPFPRPRGEFAGMHILGGGVNR